MAQRPEGSTPGGQRPVRPGWRKPGTAAAPGPRRNYHWLRRGDQGPPGRWQRRLVRYGSTALAILLIVAFIKILIWMPVKTPLITVAVTDYSAPFPPNAWAREDVDRFGKVWESQSTGWWRGLFFGQRENNIAVTPVAANWQSPQHAITSLGEVLRSKQAQPAGPGKTGVVLIYLSAHGMLDSEGRPCLLLGGAPADEAINAPLKDRVLKMSDVLAEIKKCFPPEANKVLFLDANRIDSCWPLGILYNGFAESLDQTVRGSQIENLYVLNSTSTGTVGRASPKLQASFFAHYLTEGLQRGSDQNRDGKISLHELWKYVEAKVSEQTLDDSPDLQLPTLLPTTLREKAKNVLIAWHRKTPLEPKAPPPAWDTAINRDALGELWRKHAQLRPWSTPISDATETPTPVFRQPASRRWLASWEAFQQGLIRYEQLLCAGKDYQGPAVEVKSQLDALVEALETAAPAENCVAHSLPLAEMYCPPPDPKGVEAAHAWLETPDAPRLAAENVERAIAAWNWVLAESSPKRIKRAVELLDDGKDLDPRTYIETHFLRLLGPNLKLLPDSVAGNTELLQHAFECRQAAEIAAVAAGDERVHYFIRNAVQVADAMRRQAEDKMFVGNDPEKTRGEFREAKQQFADASQRANALAKVFDTRDRGSAQLPYFAAWLSRRPAAAVDETRKAMLQQLDDALARHRDLVDQLDTLARSNKGSGGESAPDARLSKLADDCDADLENLEGFYSDAVTQAIANPGDRRNLREIEELLRVPLVTGDLRAVGGGGGLFNIMLEMLNEEKPIAPGGEAKTAPAPAALERPLYLRWAGSEKHPHPTLQLLELSAKKEVSDDAPIERAAPAAENSVVTPEMLIEAMGSLAKEGSAVQNKLALAPGEIEGELGRISEATDPQPPAIRNARAAGVNIARKTMPFLALPCRFGDPEREVFHQTQRLLQQFDQQQLMAWHAERTLDDFWGPATTEKSESYFVGVAGDYLKAAGEPDNDPAANLSELEKLLASRVAAAATPVEITVSTDLLDDTTNELTTKIVSKPDKAAPKGTAAIFVVERKDNEKVPIKAEVDNSDDKVERFAFDFENSEKLPSDLPDGVSHSLRVQIEKSTEPTLWLTSLYRAHRVEHELPFIRPELTREIVWEPSKVGPPTLAVEGEGKVASIAFVLDCSASMQKINQPNRMGPARQALADILTELASQSRKCRVSLWLYGHRCNDKDGVRIWNDQWQPVPGLLPCDDVQQVVERTVLDTDSLQRFTGLLYNEKKVMALGLTPLNLAMIRAVSEDLNHAASDAPRRLIVITDGRDYVDPNPGSKWKVTQPRTEANVVAAIESANSGFQFPIQVDLVACQVDDAGQASLSSLAKAVRGELWRVDQTNELKQNLKTALGLYSITVDRTNAPSGAERTLHTTVDRKFTLPSPNHRELYSAKVSDQPDTTAARFAVEADERITLHLQRQSSGRLALVHRFEDFNGQAKAFPPATGHSDSRPDTDFDPSKFLISVLRPAKTGANVPFGIAVQNGETTRFSPRPAEFWVEITPRVNEPSGNEPNFEPYVFYDREFQPDRPVPVLACNARNWPAEADAADVSLFFKMKATPRPKPLRIRDVRRLGDQPDEQLTMQSGSGQKIKFAVDVKSQNDEWFVSVVESHEREDANLAAAKIELLPSPDKIARRYFSTEHRIEHRFYYRNAERAEIDNADIYVLSREDLMKNAVEVAAPLRVIVAK